MAQPFLKTRYEQDIRLLPRGGGMVLGAGLVVYVILLLSIQKFAPESVQTQEWIMLATAYCFLLGAILYRHGSDALVYGVLLVLALTMPVTGGVNIVSQLSYFYIFSIAGLSIFSLVSLSGQVSLGHGAFMACGAYGSALLQSAGFDLILSLPLAIVLTTLIGFVFGLSVGRLPALFIAFASFAFAFVFLEALSGWGVAGGEQGMQGAQASALMGFMLESEANHYYLTFGVLIAGLLSVLNVQRSASGRAMRALKDSEFVARSVGVNIVHYKALAFAFSAGLMGAAGALYANWVVDLSPDAFDLKLSVTLLAMVFIGGFGRIHGVFFGAFFLVFLPEGLGVLEYACVVLGDVKALPESMSNGLFMGAEFLRRPAAQTATLGVAILVVARFVPDGLDGVWRRARDYGRAFPLYQKPARVGAIQSRPVRNRR